MPDAFVYLISVVFVLGIMILIHEWGHFVIAKAFGVRVDVFSLGFGPRLWGRKRGDTDYRISALPLGGYVKMAGDNPAEDRSGAADEFLSKPRWQRVLVVVAGPAMNILMCLLLIAGMFFFVGIPYPAYLNEPPEILGVPNDSSALAAGLQRGDRILELNGVRVSTWEECQKEFRAVPAREDLRLLVERAGGTESITVRERDRRDMFRALGYPRIPAVVEGVAPGMPADRAGMKPGDEIVMLNGKPVATWPEFTEAVRGSNGEAQHVVLRRGDGEVRVQLKPVLGGDAAWRIGISNRFELVYRKPGLVGAVGEATQVSIGMSRQILGVIGQLVTGKASIREMQGVIGIARESGQAAKRGPMDLIQLMAVISMNLGLLNLLPIPILDGGHVLLLAIEGMLRRDLSIAFKERFVQVGLVFLLLIFAIVMYNDVRRLLPGQ